MKSLCSDSAVNDHYSSLQSMNFSGLPAYLPTAARSISLADSSNFLLVLHFGWIFHKLIVRGGVLEDVLGLKDILGDTFWSPWPRGLKSSKTALSSSRGLGNFELLNCWNFVNCLKKKFEKAVFTGECLKKFLKTFFEIAWKKFLKTFFFRRTLALVSLVLSLGLEHFCPWPQEGLSSEGLFLASDFFVSLASSLVSSTPPLLFVIVIVNFGFQSQ